jgi:hypothetical protein
MVDLLIGDNKMDYENIKNQVYIATMKALYNRVDYTIIGFNTSLDYLIIWDNNGKCNIKWRK